MVSEEAAQQIWLAVGVYLCCGLVVGLFAVLFGLKRIDPAMAPTPARVRLLILPGLIALWPLIVLRLVGVRAKEDQS
jgi:hypothetical protein